MERRLPIGLGRDGEPLYVNFDFVDGTGGAHVSISGISGVATKTSFALWLLYAIFRSSMLGRRGLNTKALIFSVKGEDLLHLDNANSQLDEERGDVPGWVLVTAMTVALVLAVWAIASQQITEIIRDALTRVRFG